MFLQKRYSRPFWFFQFPTFRIPDFVFLETKSLGSSCRPGQLQQFFKAHFTFTENETILAKIHVLFRVPEFFSFFYVFTLTFYRQRKCRRRGFIYRGRADQISILGPKEEKKQLSRSFPNDAAPNISSFLTFPLQGQGVVSVYQKHSEQNKALLLRLLSLLSPAFSSNLFSPRFGGFSEILWGGNALLNFMTSLDGK